MTTLYSNTFFLSSHRWEKLMLLWNAGGRWWVIEKENEKKVIRKKYARVVASWISFFSLRHGFPCFFRLAFFTHVRLMKKQIHENYTMGRKCRVENCDYDTSKFKIKITLFSVPSHTSVRYLEFPLFSFLVNCKNCQKIEFNIFFR